MAGNRYHAASARTRGRFSTIGAGGTPDGADHQLTDRDDDVGSALYLLRDEIGNAIPPVFGEAVVDDDVLALDVAQVLEPLAKSGCFDRISRRPTRPDPADAGIFAGVCCADGRLGAASRPVSPAITPRRVGPRCVTAAPLSLSPVFTARPRRLAS
jgi:hypothetical protein